MMGSEKAKKSHLTSTTTCSMHKRAFLAPKNWRGASTYTIGCVILPKVLKKFFSTKFSHSFGPKNFTKWKKFTFTIQASKLKFYYMLFTTQPFCQIIWSKKIHERVAVAAFFQGTIRTSLTWQKNFGIWGPHPIYVGPGITQMTKKFFWEV